MIFVHVIISGFSQGRNRWHGTLKLNEELIEEIGNGIETRIWLQHWKSDWRSIAEHVWLIGQNYKEEVQVCIYAYSWGAGYGAMQFAKYLDKSNIKVRVMVLSDPVYRNPRLLLRWLAFVPGMKIKVPKNVEEVFSYYQRMNKPQGHELLAKGSTKIHSPIKLNYIHSKMDEAPSFHGMCLKQAKRVSKK